MKNVIVVGSGPAGMMAAISASKCGHRVTLLEGNNKIAKKLYISGKGRCNVTNKKTIDNFFENVLTNKEFLYSALYTFTNEDTIKFVEDGGTKLKVERGDRVFPVSDKSSDIIKSFEKQLKRNNVEILINSKVERINVHNNTIESLKLSNGKKVIGDHYIFATGGASYPLTGSDGKLFSEYKRIGHNVIELKPSLVPIEIREKWPTELQGVSIKNASMTLYKNNKKEISFQGDFIFTHFGLSGPIVLKMSRYISDDENYSIEIDLKPALDDKEFDLRLQKDFMKYSNKNFKNSLDDLLPKKFIPVMIDIVKIDPYKKINSITKQERKRILDCFKHLIVNVEGLRPVSEAIVTSGGIDVSEINPSTMKSKIIRNLSFAGEVMDVDAFTGGYNVQIAISTGFLAGNSI
ncbi:NAD(FAD)-utilizing dehydrogenase [Candidatus Arthromitus sp. SFB-mouse-SU]|uniref:NAD(P)/FAD-dependent oxidoreductase n=1 Tax=Candidatus Arthromitus sp. SFB-mouse TaxID=49118 RepID=UPI00022967BA|nr:NAD(P)/FAD-dependent oxidoreductase [Candidatus Arthromitus sp. SFB-mouse]EIA24141.1 NAD(FAD)-utilizing dehydrogenase [Candidatus Arthromitus sp. SFB-1]EIA29098.1 NAD(FAD)-utilizing dehydrogenase [Candidatus Arthromitus sp. SFB-co]EIA30684.1 NAD(FAD)-utilizing dehydrogenase [Candidatus Arthromitus sp. SFB-mouse-SU]EIA31135.1 NAD(FAD)-utilizing dehydrogenase [Candidatus Arthromitus sp. SFB-4]EIA31491.1 NAD(FAD)-utilizing dehydrogenase [Candidatus Arthromitus sp. SFB-5]